MPIRGQAPVPRVGCIRFELVQLRNRLQPLVDEHRGNSKTYNNRHVTNIDEIESLHQHVLREMMRLVEKLERDMWSAPFQRLFADGDPYDEPTPRAITEAAAIVIDFCRANLLLARDQRCSGSHRVRRHHRQHRAPS